MKSMLNVMAQVRNMHSEDMKDVDSAEEEEIDQDHKLSSLPDNPAQRMTREDAEQRWTSQIPVRHSQLQKTRGARV